MHCFARLGLPRSFTALFDPRPKLCNGQRESFRSSGLSFQERGHGYATLLKRVMLFPIASLIPGNFLGSSGSPSFVSMG